MTSRAQADLMERAAEIIRGQCDDCVEACSPEENLKGCGNCLACICRAWIADYDKLEEKE